MAALVSPYLPVRPSLDDAIGNHEMRERTSNITTQNHGTLESPSRSVKVVINRRDEKARSTASMSHTTIKGEAGLSFIVAILLLQAIELLTFTKVDSCIA